MIHQCKECDYKSDRKANLDRHFKKKHSSFDTSRVNSSLFKCDDCTYQSRFKFSLKRHIISKHLKLKTRKAGISCPLCKKTYCTRKALNEHISAKHNEAIESEEFDFDSENGKFTE